MDHRFKFIGTRKMPVWSKPNITQYIGDIKFENLPKGISVEPYVSITDELDYGANPKIYEKVKQSAEDGNTGLFGICNKGITILAKEVIKTGEDTYQLTIPRNDISFGVLDGKQTYDIIHQVIQEYKASNSQIPDECVRVKILTGLEPEEARLIAEGLNTTMSVADYSFINNRGRFQWIKDAFAKQPYANKIAYEKNTTDKEIDVREIITLVHCLNITDYPLQRLSYIHPTQAYTSKSTVLKKHQKEIENFQKAANILPDILKLYNTICHDFDKKDTCDITAGKGLSKGITMAILSAFRVLIEEKNDKYQWIGGFDNVESIWEKAIDEMVDITKVFGADHNNNSQLIAKSNSYWHNLALSLSIVSNRTSIWK